MITPTITKHIKSSMFIDNIGKYVEIQVAVPSSNVNRKQVLIIVDFMVINESNAKEL